MSPWKVASGLIILSIFYTNNSNKTLSSGYDWCILLHFAWYACSTLSVQVELGGLNLKDKSWTPRSSKMLGRQICEVQKSLKVNILPKPLGPYVFLVFREATTTQMSWAQSLIYNSVSALPLKWTLAPSKNFTAGWTLQLGVRCRVLAGAVHWETEKSTDSTFDAATQE